MSPILSETRVIEVGGRSAAVCGRLFAQLGADVLVVRRPGGSDPAEAPAEDVALAANKRRTSIDLADASGLRAFERLSADADLAVLDLPARELDALSIDPARLAALNPRLVVAAITPFGLTGPHRDYLGGDLVAFHASGIARLLVGHVDDPAVEPPARAAGDQADFITGLTAACAAMHALYQQQRIGGTSNEQRAASNEQVHALDQEQRTGGGRIIDVSAQEAMALMAARELAMPGFGGQPAPRGGRQRGGNAVIAVLPALDGYVAISPREAHQWRRWLDVLGSPAWGAEPRFATRAQRTANFDALYERMAAWSRGRRCAEIFDACQRVHVPCFPFGAPGDMLDEPQLRHRKFFTPIARADGNPVLIPRPPFGLPRTDYAGAAEPPFLGDDWLSRDGRRGSSLRPVAHRPLPLAGIRVLDFSWVIAGPTCTRYLALMGAEVIKVEAPDKPDTGRVSELHDVLGQSKLGLSIDLKAVGALEAVRRLIERTDVIVENFATGVMERLGLGYDALRAIRPDIVLLSASGLGRTGPGAEWVAYGNLLSAYSGFAALNDPTTGEPRTGLAWADPLCGLFMAFAVVAALRRRDQRGEGRHIDFSMLEGLLWTMPGALLTRQLTGAEAQPTGNDHPTHTPHGVYRCAGEDRWLAVAVADDAAWRALCGVVPELHDLAALTVAQRRAARDTIDARLAAWARDHDDIEAMKALQAAGVPAAASYTTTDLFADAHLWDRSFYQLVRERDGTERFLPGLPWRWGDGSLVEPEAAPAQGQDNERVLRDLAGLTQREVAALRLAGALSTDLPPSAAG
jgi:crotonobetainyl-CoA:carnitine CoA-transferase CaiB-like acyl-CoA transferase